LDKIVKRSEQNSNRTGYFAALYKIAPKKTSGKKGFYFSGPVVLLLAGTMIIYFNIRLFPPGPG